MKKMYLMLAYVSLLFISAMTMVMNPVHAAETAPAGVVGFIVAHKVALASIAAVLVNEIIAYNDNLKQNSLIQLLLAWLVGIKK